jgi:hypothetical protein
MQYEDGTTWRPPSAPEQPDFGTVAVPDHPGHLMPSPGALHQAFSDALTELEHGRGREPHTSGYAARSQEAVYEAGIAALTASLRAIYQEAQRDNPSAIAFLHEAIPEMQVVASSPGSGKSTSAKAFMLAVAREGLKDKYPLGCAFVVQHIETAANAYGELNALLPSQVALWTSEHDADNPAATKQPRFTVSELDDYPIIIVTHEFFKGVRGEKARLHRRNGMSFPRAVTFVDEKVEQVKVYDVKFSDIVQVLEHIEGTDDSPVTLKDALRTLDSFAGKKRAARTASWKRPKTIRLDGALHANSSGSRQTRRNSTHEAAVQHCRTLASLLPTSKASSGLLVAWQRTGLSSRGRGTVRRARCSSGTSRSCRTTEEWCCWTQPQT